MKKLIAIVLTLVLALSFAACAQPEAAPAETAAPETTESAAPSELVKVKVLNAVKDELKAAGYDLEVVEFTDYVLPNTALEQGDLDANYFQHTPYLENFNEENGTHLVAVGKIHYEPFGIYAGKTSDLSAIPEGGSIAIPNDGTNEARALLLLEAQGLIKLKEGITFTATVLDIAENPKNLSIKEIEAAQLARSLQDVDAAVINGNYAIQADLKVKDALAIEDKDSIAADTYANVLVVKEGHENDEATKALLAALQSDTAKKFMEEKYEGAVIAAF